MSICDGKGGANKMHCCIIKGEICKYYSNYRCTLRTELGSWDKVHNDPRYLQDVKLKLIAANVKVDCGNWPTPEMIELVRQGKRKPCSICCYSKLIED